MSVTRREGCRLFRPGLESRPSIKDKMAMEARTASVVRGLLGIACLWAAAPLLAQPAPADLLLTGGRVYTFAWDEPALDGTPAANAPRSAAGFRPDAEAVAIRGDRIVIAVHAIGDAGNRETLDFIESVLRAQPEARALRHRIEHAQVLHPDDVPRFARLGVIASMEPPHCVEDKAWAEARLGPERVKGAYAWRTLRLVGARLAFNSDLTGSDHDIFYGLHSAITRRDKQLQPPGGWHPEQRMTPEEAVRGYTTWNAYAASWEKESGLLAPGRWADITVMDIDPLVMGATDPGRLLRGAIRATIVGGKIAYAADTLGKASQ
jgi:Amidohydrolase family